MAKLYYGSGEVTIEGSGIVGVQIKYRGNIKIEKTAGDSFVMAHANNGIIFFPVGEGYLNELFKYSGTLKITSVIAADSNGERVLCSIKRVMDYSELLNSTAETMTMKAEDMVAGYDSTKKIDETPQILENLHTKDKDTPFYLEDGSEYRGYYHIHLTDSSCMTGKDHSEGSQELYFKQVKNGDVIDKLIPTKNPSHIPPALKLRKIRRI
tara:strand:- start:1276 stop:1905 length:630 start_codon:yes stop_codon:yes gene_type:complete